MADKIFVRKIQENLWQWRSATAGGEWHGTEFFTGDINLLKESIEGKLVWLILPGTQIVSQRVAADISDRRQLLQTLPFELEEDIIEPVDDMHFAYGSVENDTIPVAYGDAEYMADAIAEIESAGADVQRVLVDYLQMERPAEGWVLLLENGLLSAHTGVGVGFTVEQELAGLYLNQVADSNVPAAIDLIGEDDKALAKLEQLLPDVLTGNESLQIEKATGFYWDLLNPTHVPGMDFRTGRLARKLPFAQWWHVWKTPIIAYAAAFVLAVGATWMAQHQTAEEQKRIMAQTDEIFRQAVPNGPITDPERQLRIMVGGSGAVGQPSHAVKMITSIAPAVKSIGDIKVRNFRYNADNNQLQLNIEASSFGTFEALRSKIAEGGYEVEIKSANVYGDTHQAQLRITGAG